MARTLPTMFLLPSLFDGARILPTIPPPSTDAGWSTPYTPPPFARFARPSPPRTCEQRSIKAAWNSSWMVEAHEVYFLACLHYAKSAGTSTTKIFWWKGMPKAQEREHHVE